MIGVLEIRTPFTRHVTGSQIDNRYPLRRHQGHTHRDGVLLSGQDGLSGNKSTHCPRQFFLKDALLHGGKIPCTWIPALLH